MARGGHDTMPAQFALTGAGIFQKRRGGSAAMRGGRMRLQK